MQVAVLCSDLVAKIFLMTDNYTDTKCCTEQSLSSKFV